MPTQTIRKKNISVRSLWLPISLACVLALFCLVPRAQANQKLDSSTGVCVETSEFRTVFNICRRPLRSALERSEWSRGEAQALDASWSCACCRSERKLRRRLHHSRRVRTDDLAEAAATLTGR
jgi:hypothetical protein